MERTVSEGEEVRVNAPHGHDLDGSVKVTYWSDGTLSIDIASGPPLSLTKADLYSNRAELEFRPDWNR